MFKNFLRYAFMLAVLPLSFALSVNAGDQTSSPQPAAEQQEKPAESATAEEAGGLGVPEASFSENVTDPNLLPVPEGMDDLKIFKTFYSDRPLLAAKAMLNILDSVPVKKAEEFQDKALFQITEMIIALDSKRKKGDFSEEEYSIITKRLGAYGLYTLKTDAYAQPKQETGMAIGIMSIDTIPPKPGLKPRPWLSPNQNSGNSKPGHGTLMSGALQGTLIPPKDGTSAQLVPEGESEPVELNPVTALVSAKKAFSEGDTASFHSALETAEKYFPSKTRLHVAAASLYYEAREYKKSELAATRAIGLSKNDPEAYKARAVARSALNNRKGAIADVNKAVSIDPQDESARLLTLFIESRKEVKSIKTVISVQEMKRQLGIRTSERDVPRGDAVNIDSESSQIPQASDNGVSTDYAKSQTFTKTAKAKNRLGDYESAVAYASLALDKDPDNLEAYLERANAYNQLGKYEDVIRDTTYVIEKDRNNMQAFNLRSWASNHINDPQSAAEDADNAININPNFADAWYNRGVAAEKQGDYKRMLEDFKQAATLNEEYNRKYQDALAQYGARVPGFSPASKTQESDLGKEVQEPVASPMSRYLMLLVFMLVGGALIAFGFASVLTGQSSSSKNNNVRKEGKRSADKVISPSVFYEGVATGKYKIEKKVGEGAMGKVYLAVDKSLGRKVAIKKMNDEIKVNEREKQRFLEEARTVALLHHPNIVEIYTIFEESGDVFLVFEYLEGRTLDTVLSKDIRMSFNRVKGIFVEVSKALEYAHSKGVIHRDLKLSNIMLTSESYVKVMDFGLSGRAIESKANSGNAEIVGSPAYMAPEQENGTSSIRSDIYSMGICIYESLTGVLPFQGPDFYNQKMRNFYEPVSQCVQGLPKSVDALLEKCLDVDPEKRFADAAEFRAALDSIHV